MLNALKIAHHFVEMLTVDRFPVSLDVNGVVAGQRGGEATAHPKFAEDSV